MNDIPWHAAITDMESRAKPWLVRNIRYEHGGMVTVYTRHRDKRGRIVWFKTKAQAEQCAAKLNQLNLESPR